MTKYKKGDIVQLVHNTVVVNDQEDGEIVEVKDIDRKMSFTIQGERLIETVASADYFKKTHALGKVALAEKLTHSNGQVLTISYQKENGKERVLRGTFSGPDPLMGRSYVKDIDKNDGHPRLVNHRAINWIILDGVKYIKK